MSHPLVDMEMGPGSAEGSPAGYSVGLIDRTPYHVAGILLLAALGLWVLQKLGFRFVFGAGVNAGVRR